MAAIAGSKYIVEMEAAALRQLVNAITDQILQGSSIPKGARPASVATPVPARGASFRQAPDLAAYIDHTNLKPEATRPDIERLCAEAREHAFAAVCVQPIWVDVAVRSLRGTAVAVGTVVGFPGGAVPTGAKRQDAALAIRKGATELDMVLAIGMLRQGSLDYVKQDIAGVAALCKRHGVLLKVILETATLTREEVAVGCALAKLAGADYVKTSTGVHPAGGATEDAIVLMRQVVGDALGVKASGGIRTVDDARRMLAAGASRIGTSAGVAMVQA